MAERRHLDLRVHGQPALATHVGHAIDVERRHGLRPTRVRVRSWDVVEEGLWELTVDADELLAEGIAWVGGQLARDLDDGTEDGGDGTWQGEILEVHAATRRIWVATSAEEAPLAGLAKVWPFDYLSAPYQVARSEACEPLRQDYADLLAAARGRAVGVPRPVVGLNPAWNHSWVLVWGPPGTGKTWTLGRQVEALVKGDPTERVLVVSTTNRATDAAAVEVGRAVLDGGRPRGLQGFARVGRILEVDRFVDAGLEALIPVDHPDDVDRLRGPTRWSSRQRAGPTGPARAGQRHACAPSSPT